MGNRITWLIPVKNGMPYIRETLASIEKQTYKNWEVLVWDNESTDGTLEELSRWIPERLPGRVITGQPYGVGGSLARMVELCQTEFCARIDADDINHPDRLEKQIAFLQSNPHVAVLGCQMHCINAQGAQKGSYQVPNTHTDIYHKLLSGNSMAHPSVLFRRSAILDVGNYQELPNIEDYDLWLRVATKYELANLADYLVYYRVHDRSATQVATREGRVMALERDCIAQYSQKLFGCDPLLISALRKKEVAFSLPRLFEISKYLKHISSADSRLGSLRSDSLIESFRGLVASKDIISRLFLAALSRKNNELIRESLRISKQFLLKIPAVPATLSKVRHLHWQYIQRKYKNCTITSDIELLGIKQPFQWIDMQQCHIERDLTIWISEYEGAEPKLTLKGSNYIGRNCFLGVHKPITIGQHVQIGAYSYIISANHSYASRKLPIYAQGFIGAEIVIEDEVWIGAHVVILPGVTIGRGAIIGAGSVVTRSIPEYEIWAGVPAKFIKCRPDDGTDGLVELSAIALARPCLLEGVLP
jgi:acetyltransferase-like isoleucine patch superfamily enzyme/glycosyltransferase involved in cell wall biosynthesis